MNNNSLFSFHVKDWYAIVFYIIDFGTRKASNVLVLVAFVIECSHKPLTIESLIIMVDLSLFFC